MTSSRRGPGGPRRRRTFVGWRRGSVEWNGRRQRRGVRRTSILADWMDLYVRKDERNSLRRSWLCQHFHDVAYESLSEHARGYINQFVKHFLHLFTSGRLHPEQ